MKATRLPFSLAVMAVLLAAPLATALASNVEWDWSFSDSTVSASGTLTTNSLSGGSYLITNVTGDWGVSNPIRQVDQVDGFLGSMLNDNLLLNGTPQLDLEGFAFTLMNGQDINIYYSSGSYDVEIVNGNATTFSIGTFSATPVPLPTSAWLMLSGLGGLGLLHRRK